MVAAERLGLPYATGLVIAAGSFARPEVVAAPRGAPRAEHGLPPDADLAMLSRHLILSPFPPGYRDPRFPLPATAHALRPFTSEPAAACEAVPAVLAEPTYRHAAARLREEIDRLPGPEHAVDLLERLATDELPTSSAGSGECGPQARLAEDQSPQGSTKPRAQPRPRRPIADIALRPLRPTDPQVPVALPALLLESCPRSRARRGARVSKIEEAPGERMCYAVGVAG